MVELKSSLEQHHETAKEHLQVQKEMSKHHVEAEERLEKKNLKGKEEECHQIFRLSKSSHGATYEWYKDRVDRRIEGTCTWFLQHDAFQSWLNQDSGPLLVSADPGCGKSVLAKYLIDEFLPAHCDKETICYFFFNDQDQNTMRQALCAILHQLFDQNSSLITHAMFRYKKDGPELRSSMAGLWQVFQQAVADPIAGPVIVVLDALDECLEEDFRDLMQRILAQFPNENSKLKYLLTSRPYTQIISEFHHVGNSFPNVWIPGEEESETISQEVNLVIKYRVAQLAQRKRLSHKMRDYLEKKLQGANHRTYLWAYLVFDDLEKDFKATEKGIDAALLNPPRTVNEAYAKILTKSQNYDKARIALNIILAAIRPFTVREMNIAMEVEENDGGYLKSVEDLDLEEDDRFQLRLRSWCGLFISIHHERIYFMHQTAREFLLSSEVSNRGVISAIAPQQWRTTLCQAHYLLAKICMAYWKLLSSNKIQAPNGSEVREYGYYFKRWHVHFRLAGVQPSDALVSVAMNFYDPKSNCYHAAMWYNGPDHSFWLEKREVFEWEDIGLAAFFGHDAIVHNFILNGTDVNKPCSRRLDKPLSCAVAQGHETTVKLLLMNGAEVNKLGGYTSNPSLVEAVRRRYEGVVKVLIEYGADVDLKTRVVDRGPLFYAVGIENQTIAELLLDGGAQVDPRDTFGQTPLLYAARNGDTKAVKLLLDYGAAVNAKDSDKRTPLMLSDLREITLMLLEKGAEVDRKDINGMTALHMATDAGCLAIVKLLLAYGAKVDDQDKYGQTALSRAAATPFGAADDVVASILILLVANGADINSEDIYGYTPLSHSIKVGNKSRARLILEQGGAGGINNPITLGITPLMMAVSRADEDLVRLLLDNGADVNTSNGNGDVALTCISPPIYILQLLLESGADVNAQNNTGHTALMRYSDYNLTYADILESVALGGTVDYSNAEDTIKMLLDHGANINLQDTVGRSALFIACWHPHPGIIKLLLQYGADPNSVNEDGQTPLILVAGGAYICVPNMRVLLEHGANINMQDERGDSALMKACIARNNEAVKLLLESKADIDLVNKRGFTALLSIIEEDASEYREIAQLLLEHGASLNTTNDVGAEPIVANIRTKGGFWSAMVGTLM